MEYIKSKNQIALRLQKGEEVLTALMELAKSEKINAASLSGLGATDSAELGMLETKEKKYVKKTYSGDMEIASLTGNISSRDGEPYLHLHAVLGGENGVYAGHLNKAVISATAEIFMSLFDAPLFRRYDEETGLFLMHKAE